MSILLTFVISWKVEILIKIFMTVSISIHHLTFEDFLLANLASMPKSLLQKQYQNPTSLKNLNSGKVACKYLRQSHLYQKRTSEHTDCRIFFKELIFEYVCKSYAEYLIASNMVCDMARSWPYQYNCMVELWVIHPK